MALSGAKHIIGLPVETQHGQKLGKVSDIQLDVDAHTVKYYAVSPSSLVRKVVQQKEDVLVAPTQVLSITEEKMVVTDLTGGEAVDAGEMVDDAVEAAERLGAAPVPDQSTTAE